MQHECRRVENNLKVNFMLKGTVSYKKKKKNQKMRQFIPHKDGIFFFVEIRFKEVFSSQTDAET